MKMPCKNIIGLLLRCMESVVSHNDKLKKMTNLNPKYPFHGILILKNNEVLSNLKTIVTINPSHAGVPPHAYAQKIRYAATFTLGRADTKKGLGTQIFRFTASINK